MPPTLGYIVEGVDAGAKLHQLSSNQSSRRASFETIIGDRDVVLWCCGVWSGGGESVAQRERVFLESPTR